MSLIDTVTQRVIEGLKDACRDAGISLSAFGRVVKAARKVVT